MRILFVTHFQCQAQIKKGCIRQVITTVTLPLPQSIVCGGISIFSNTLLKLGFDTKKNTNDGSQETKKKNLCTKQC